MAQATIDTPATEAQLDYIRSLISKCRTPYTLEARDKEGRKQQDAIIVRDLFNAIIIPTELTQKRASAWINLLKQGGLTAIYEWLDKPAAAKSFGVADYIEAHRNEIEKAVA